MGTTARVYVAGGPDDLPSRLFARLDELENRWSRFIASSEVCELNRLAGEPVIVSEDTWLLVRRAREAAARTRGWFDPMLLPQLRAAGYDRSFELLDPPPSDLVVVVDNHGDAEPSVHEWSSPCRLIVMRPDERSVTLPPDAAFDPGGLGKGLAADLLAAQAMEAGARAAMISLGGDIAVVGTPPEGGWHITIEHHADPERSIGTVALPWGAMATSTKTKRRWRTDDGEAHHLLDPRTGIPSTSDVLSASVIAGRCWQAEAYAKAAVVAGIDVGLELLEHAGVQGLLVDREGRHVTTADFRAYLAAVPA